MKRLLNDEWEYLKMPVGSNLDDAGKSSAWEGVDLPHDWLIWQSDDLYESADAWYRRKLFFDSGIPETCLLHFDGVYMNSEVFLNGELICSHAYGYTAFYADLSGKIRNGENEIHVHIRHESPNSRWYSGSGIFRDVHLLEYDGNHIVPDSFYLTERETENGWYLKVEAETHKPDQGLFLYEIVDQSGKTIVRGDEKSAEGRIRTEIDLSGAEPWEPDHPVLYCLKYRFGKEEGTQMFGLRVPEFTTDRGFFLNHKPLKLKGVCLHHDLGALGAAFHEKAARRQLMLMKEMGVNALRTSHNPPASKLLDLCDEMGILVIDEAFDMWERPKTTYDYARFFPEHEEEDVALWIRRDRCHPCVIMWSVGNEIYDMHADLRGAEVCKMLTEQVHAHDPEEHGKVTFGCNYMPWEGGQRCAEIVRVVGYNYGEKLYAEHHKKYPHWVIYGSETASVLSSRGIYHFPIEHSIMSEADLQCSALGNSNTSWGATDLKKMIVEDLQCAYSMGQFIWTGIDYIGEPTPYHTRSCYFGQADTACFPKDAYYLFRSLWTDKPVLHIGVNWDWNPGQMIDVPVMTNYRHVELLLNGVSLGKREIRQDDPEKCLPVWKTAYEPGILSARALDDEGNIIEETSRETPGDTRKLLLTSESSTLTGDGHDIVFVTVQALDEKGRPVDNARDQVTVRVSGGAYLAGTDNGDSTDRDGYKLNRRRLFGGKLLLIIASDGTSEDVKISVENSEGVRAELSILTEPSERIPGTSCRERIKESGEVLQLVPIRKIEIRAEENRELTREKNTCVFNWKLLPETANRQPVEWQITNAAGIITPYTELEVNGEKIRVTAHGDGEFYLRALSGNAQDHPEIISQLEFNACGIGNPALNPFEFISAGLYDLHTGEIGTGNEKGIAFARDGESSVGFSRLDFGKTGSDTLILPIFALDGKAYEIELLDGKKDGKSELISRLHYEKPSIWNEYQEETYHLPVPLKGIHTLIFRMKQKVHMKGFRFVPQNRAQILHHAAEADSLYGDSFRVDGEVVRNIGNNVSLLFEDMDFGDGGNYRLMIRGKTDLNTNTITVRIKGENDEKIYSAGFLGGKEKEQYFSMEMPKGVCSVTFVFLPGSSFDFEAFRFISEQEIR